MDKEKNELEKKYSEIFVELYDARNVSLKKKQSNEYALHVIGSSANLKKITEYINSKGMFENSPFHILQQSNQTKWLSHKSWTDLAYKLELAELKIKREEALIIDSFKQGFIDESNAIRDISHKLGYLDTLISFAMLAKEKNLVCPKMNRSTKLEIVKGRHLMVEES